MTRLENIPATFELKSGNFSFFYNGAISFKFEVEQEVIVFQFNLYVGKIVQRIVIDILSK